MFTAVSNLIKLLRHENEVTEETELLQLCENTLTEVHRSSTNGMLLFRDSEVSIGEIS